MVCRPQVITEVNVLELISSGIIALGTLLSHTTIIYWGYEPPAPVYP